MLKPTEKIWHNGHFVPWEDARIHVLSHVVSYGSSVFEGIRCYATPSGPAIFRLREHVRRMVDSARIYRMEDLGFSADQLAAAMVELVRVNKLEACYIRPIALRGYAEMGVHAGKNPIEVYIACWEWGKYLGEEALTKGAAVKVGSWARMAPNTLPAMAKAGGNYLNSQLLKLEAVQDGYDEAIALDVNGYVSEGSGENLFAVYHGEILTPPVSSSILSGITRDSVMRLAHDLGYTVREAILPREMLYIVDELFFTGTAVEVTPISSVDRIKVGSGERGPVTKAIQDAFFGMVRGDLPDRYGWLSPVPKTSAQRA